MRAGESFYTPMSIVFWPIGACCILLVCFELVVGHLFFMNKFFFLCFCLYTPVVYFLYALSWPLDTFFY